MPLLRPCLSSTLLTPLSRPALRTFTTTASRPLANINLVGRLAAEPELTPTSSGTDMIRYSLGTGHGNRENRSTSWWKVACFLPEGSARDALLSLGKGSMVYVEGSCKINKFQDKEGREHTALNIVQRHFEILDKRDSDGKRVSSHSGSEEAQPDVEE